MRRTLVVAAGAVAVGAIALLSGAIAAPTTESTPTQRLAGPPSTIVQYGYVRSLVRSGGAYRLRFDPALWLSGETANRAAIEDGVIGAGESVPNDYYIRNESRRPLSYTVARSARVTVVTNSATGGLRSTRIAVSELAAIVRGRNPNRRELYGRHLGYWARFAVDRVTGLDQQYQP